METKNSAFNEVRKYSNEQLRELLKEIKKISNHDAPRYVAQSINMIQLFALEEADYNTWLDTFRNVQNSIEREILFRVLNDVW